MKKFLLNFTVIFLLFNNLLPAQKNVHTKSTTPVATIKKEDLDASPFSKGKWEFTIAKPCLEYGHQNIKVNDVKQGSQGQFALDLGTNYYVANGIGIGLALNADFNTVKNNSGSKQTSNSWMAYANFTYGTAISNNFNFYARAGLGLGGVTDKYTPVSGTSNTDKSDLFGYKFAAGFPIQLQNGGPVYFTPELRYRHRREKFDDATETDNRFGLGLKLETFLFCREMQCDGHVGHAFSQNAYNQGRSYLGVSTKGMMDFGTVKTEYDNNFPGSEEDYSQANLQVNYMYYIVRDLSLGVNVDFGNSVYKDDASNFKQTASSFSFMPMAELNIPVKEQALNNLFIRGGYGFGTIRNEYKNGTTTNTTKYSSTGFCAGLGYNFFFHKGLSFTPIFEYDIATYKNKTTDVKEKYSGIELSMGIRKFF